MHHEACCRRQTVEIKDSLQIQQITISHAWRDDLEPRKVILYILRLITSAVTEEISGCLAMSKTLEQTRVAIPSKAIGCCEYC